MHGGSAAKAIHRLIAEPVGKKACADAAFIEDCLQHARMARAFRKDAWCAD